MMTLRLFSENLETIPATTSWYLADLGEARGRQELFTRQSPQRLKVLREHALIESAVSSNRMEGVEVDQARVGTIVFGRSHLRDRNEEEVRGYQQALKIIHEKAQDLPIQDLPITDETVMMLHRLSHGDIWDAGKYKEKDGDIIETYSNGRKRVRFKTVTAAKTPASMKEIETLWAQCLREKWIHPLIALAAFNLDFLCIHPFRDGNGRMARLLTLLMLYEAGYEVGRYVSLERIIEESKESYYGALKASSEGWHEGQHSLAPWRDYLLGTIVAAYRELERRTALVATAPGAKQALVRDTVSHLLGEFTTSSLEKACPGVSPQMIRHVLREMQAEGKVERVGERRGSKWRRVE